MKLLSELILIEFVLLSSLFNEIGLITSMNVKRLTDG